MSSSYKLEEFLDECKNNPGDIKPTFGCVEKASKDLNLNTEREVVDYVGGKDVTDFIFQYSDVWDNIFKNSGKKLMIDNYHFFISQKKYFFSFGKNLKGKWAIKSLHLDDSEIVNKDLKNQMKKFNEMRLKGEGETNE